MKKTLYRCGALLIGLWGVIQFGGCSGKAPSTEPTAAAVTNPDDFRKALDDSLDNAASRRLNIKDHAAWQVVHGALAFGKEYLISVDGQDVKAVDYLFKGGMMNGWVLSPGGKGVIAKIEPGSVTGQGHPDQWIGYLSQIGLQLDDPLIVGEKEFKARDLLNQSKWAVNDLGDPEELETLAWTLMACTVFVPLDEKWMNYRNEEWSIERLVDRACRENNGNPYEGACQGAHRLYALSKAVSRYRSETKTQELTGVWKTANDRVQQALHDAKANQNADGTYSPTYFLRTGNSPDPVDKIRAGGHVLEFVTVAATDEQLQEPWVTHGVLALTKLFKQTKNLDVECGALYHAANALKNYRERRFGPRNHTNAVAAQTDGR